MRSFSSAEAVSRGGSVDTTGAGRGFVPSRRNRRAAPSNWLRASNELGMDVVHNRTTAPLGQRGASGGAPMKRRWG